MSDQSSPQQSNQPLSDLMGSLLTSLIGGQSVPQQAPQASSDLMGSRLTGLMGGQSTPQQAPQASSDLMGSLLSGLIGNQSTPQQAPQASSDLMGSLLTDLMGGQTSQQQPQQQDDGLDMGDLLSAGMVYLNAKQHGKNTLEALVSALLASSQGGQTPYRVQSSALVVKTLLQLLGSQSAQ